VQDEIAAAIASKLAVILADANVRVVRPTTSHWGASDRFLKARSLMARRVPALTFEAIALAEQATALDPDFAAAYPVLGEGVRQQAFIGGRRDLLAPAKEATANALRLDPHLAEAFAIQAHIALLVDRDASTAFTAWNRALTLNPLLSEARAFYAGWGLTIARRNDDAAAAGSQRAVEDDPRNAVCAAIHATILGIIGRHGDAIQEAQRAVELDPASYFAHMVTVYVHHWAGDVTGALAASELALSMSGRSPNNLTAMSALHAARGDRGKSVAAHQEIMSRAAVQLVSPTFLAISALGAGVADEAMEHAVRAVEEHCPNQLWLVRRPGTEALHDHPRYPELRERMGF